MSTYLEYSIGRRQDADIVISDQSVSRVHAELLHTSDGRFYLTDCNSTSGTSVKRHGSWLPVRQEFVAPQEMIRFGRIVCTPLQLLQLTSSHKNHSQAARSKEKLHKGRSKPDPKDALPEGSVKRNPMTGEIESKK